MSSRSPLVVEIVRGDQVESVHLVDAVAIDRSGVIVAEWGDPDRPTLPRSAIKPIQALPLVRSGASIAAGNSRIELALACASHSGEPAHVTAVAAWLARISTDASALECGAHRPVDDASAIDLACRGEPPSPVHNNCSGKHAGFLGLCAHLELDHAGYLAASHPLQRDHVTPAIEEMCGVSLAGQVPGIDGCGIPVWSIGLDRIAHGWARLPGDEAGHRLLEAMIAEPFYVAGTERACTRLITAAQGAAVVKTGAEGVYCGVIVDGELGLALKVRDGGRRAAEAVMEWLLREMGVSLPDDSGEIRNWAGTPVGIIRVRAASLGPSSAASDYRSRR